MSVESRLRELTQRWESAAPAERSNAQLYLAELAEALGVERPRPSGAGYEFEYAVRVVTRDGTETVKRADLFRMVVSFSRRRTRRRTPPRTSVCGGHSVRPSSTQRLSPAERRLICSSWMSASHSSFGTAGTAPTEVSRLGGGSISAP